MSFPIVVPQQRTAVLPVWVAPCVAATVLQLAIFAGYLARFHGDLSILVGARIDAVGVPPFEAITIGLSERGFDGYQYYAISRAPFRAHDERSVTMPPYRHLRIVYPLAAWALSGGGDPHRLLWVMPLINLCAISLLAAMGANFASRLGRHPWWGFLLPLLINATTPALRNLTDPTATLALFGFVTTWILGGSAWRLGAWALLAVFCREQNCAIVGFVALLAAFERRWLVTILLLGAIAALGCWVIQVFRMYHDWPYVSENFEFPLSGMLYRWTHRHGDQTASAAPIHALGLLYYFAMYLVVAVMVVRRGPKLAMVIAGAGAVLAICGGSAIWMDGHSYTRVFVWLPLGIWFWTIQTGRRWPALILAPALLWPVYAIFQVWRR